VAEKVVREGATTLWVAVCSQLALHERQACEDLARRTGPQWTAYRLTVGCEGEKHGKHQSYCTKSEKTVSSAYGGLQVHVLQCQSLLHVSVGTMSLA
jgi:hypothetical protein